MKLILLSLISFFVIFLTDLKSQQQQYAIKDEFIFGFNTISKSLIGQTYLFEMKMNMSEDLLLNLSLGYQKTYLNRGINIKSYDKNLIDESHLGYSAMSYKISKNEYDMIPLSFGTQYNLINGVLTPYLSLAISYNFINSKSFRDEIIVHGIYSNIEELPIEYRIKHTENLPNHSYSFILGVGFIRELSRSADLDFRYVFKYETKLISTHQLLVGLII